MVVKDYKYMTKTLQNMHKKHVSVKQKERKKTNALLDATLTIVLQEMIKCDSNFRSLQPRLSQYLGAYFESLVVNQTKPIPVYLELGMFLKHKKKEIEMKMEGPNTTITAINVTSEVLVDGKVSHLKLMNLIRTVLIKSGNAIKKQLKQKKLSLVKIDIIGEPDKFFEINLKVGAVNINLIPIISMKLDRRPKSCTIDFEKARYLGPEYFLFPAEDEDSNQFLFKVILAQQEKRLMKSKYHLKFILRILKVILIGQGIQLTDYCIKTLFLLEIQNQSNVFWICNTKGFLLLHVLKVLKKHFEEKEMETFWDAGDNLLREHKEETLELWATKLALIIDVIEKRQPINHFFPED